MSRKDAIKVFEALDALARKYRHAVHSEVCNCKACVNLLQGIVTAEDAFAKALTMETI